MKYVLILACAVAFSVARAEQPRELVRVHDQVITQRDVEDELCRTLQTSVRGALIRRRVVENALAERGVEVPPRLVDDKLEELRSMLSMQVGRELSYGAVASSLRVKPQALRESVRLLAAIEELMARDGRYIPGGPLMPAVRKAMKAYVDERVRNTAIVTDADELPEGVVARVGQLSVTDADVREAVLEQVSDEQRREAREFLVDRALLRHMLGAKKLLPLTPDDRALQEDFVRYQLQKDRTWRRADVTLDAFLQNTRGMGLEAFRRTRDFRLNVMLTKIAAAQVTDSMLRQLYEADPHRYGDDQRRARAIRIYAFPELAARPTTAEQHQRLKQRRAEIDRQLGAGKDFAAQFARAEARAREILQKLNGEVRFETLAAVYNDDPDLARVRGDLGFVARDAKDLDPALVEAIYSTPVGQRSDVVRGRYGYFIVKTVAERDVSFEDARKALRFAAIAEQRRHVLEALRRQRAEAVTNLRKDEAESGAP